MKFCCDMTKEEWKEVFEKIKSIEGVTVNYFAETNRDGLFVSFKYIIFEYRNRYFYIQADKINFDGLIIYPSIKISPYEKKQIGYPVSVHNMDELITYISHPKEDIACETQKQKIYLTELYGIKNERTDLWRLKNKLAGFREKNILNNLDKIEMIRNSEGYKELRFWHKNGKEVFDYECNRKKIVG